MPTAANNASTRSAKPRAKAAKSTTSRSRTKAKATRAKGARTRAANQTRTAVRQAETATRDTAVVFGDYAERAVLIPVGVALTARDRAVSTVSDTFSTYSSS